MGLVGKGEKNEEVRSGKGYTAILGNEALSKPAFLPRKTRSSNKSMGCEPRPTQLRNMALSHTTRFQIDVIAPILQMRTLKIKAAEQFAHSHIFKSWQNAN